MLPLLNTGDYGRVWVINSGRTSIGYAVLCFSYSIKSGGRGALIIEFYIDEDQRGRGFGDRALDLILDEARNLGVVSLYVAVAGANAKGRELFRSKGFEPLDRQLLMHCPLKD